MLSLPRNLWRAEWDMSDVVQFFVKQDKGDEAAKFAPPYLLTFGIERSNVPQGRASALPILEAIKASEQFAEEHPEYDPTSASEGADYDNPAALFGLTDAIINNGHMVPQVQQMLASLVVHLVTNTEARMAAVIEGAVSKVGLLVSPGGEMGIRQAGAAIKAAGPSVGGVGMFMLASPLSPLQFRYVSDTKDE